MNGSVRSPDTYTSRHAILLDGQTYSRDPGYHCARSRWPDSSAIGDRGLRAVSASCSDGVRGQPFGDSRLAGTAGDWYRFD